MNHTGFFFCGLLVGVVVSAAFGLDFFPTPRETEHRVTSLNPAAPAGEPSAAASAAERQSAATLDESARKVRSLEARLKETTETLRANEAELAALKETLKDSEPAGVAGGALSEPEQSLLEKERRRSEHLKADLELAREETYNLLKRFFASKRNPEHAVLVSEYFATSAPEKLKGDLVDQLLEKNRDVIAALAPVSSLLAEDKTAESGGLTSVSAKAGISRPARALPGPDEPEKLGPRQESESPDFNPDGAIADPNKALTLPPPPGR